MKPFCRQRIPFKNFAANSGAASAVEFALLAPLFIVLLLGMVAYGIYFGASHSLQQISADAARTAVAGLDATERRSLVTAFIAANASGYPFIDAPKLTVTADDSAADANQFVVSVRYDARDLPIWNLFRTLPLPDTTIARSATIRIGGL